MRILVVEDDAALGEAVELALKHAGHAVDRASTGEFADRVLREGRFDLVVLDLNLPKLDGREVLKRLRARSSPLPVLVLSARDSAEEKAAVLDLGADDYLAKPFSVNELQARVRALLRRGQYDAATHVARGALGFDTVTRTLTIRGSMIALSAREISVFELLFQHYGRVVSKEQIVERLYGYDEAPSLNAIEVYISRLRKKLEGSGAVVRTCHGRGYQLDEDLHTAAAAGESR